MNRAVAIVGSHSSARETAPFERDDTDIWVFNGAPSLPDTWVKRCDGLFQMHHPAIYQSLRNREDPHYWRWLQQPHEYPIWMLAVDPLVPASVAYPLEDVCAHLLPAWKVDGALKRYFSSSIEYAVALAIHQEYDAIEIHGIRMASNTEYSYQRTGLAFWEGVAVGRGILVDHYGGGAIFDRPLYGYEGNLEIDIDALQDRRRELVKARKAAQEASNAADNIMLGAWRNLEGLTPAVSGVQAARAGLGRQVGALEEIERCLDEAQASKRAGQPCFVDRNKHEERAAAAIDANQEYDRLGRETSATINASIGQYNRTHDPAALLVTHRAVAQLAAVAQEFGRLTGIEQENRRLMAQIDKTLAAAGGERALDLVRNIEQVTA